MEAFGECPPLPRRREGRVRDALGASVGERARWLCATGSTPRPSSTRGSSACDLRRDRASAGPGAGRAWSVTASASIPRRLEAFAKELEREPRQPYARDLPAGRRGVHDRLAQAARADPVREAEAAARCGGRRPATPPTPTCSPSWPLGHPLPAKILEHRTLAKLKGTYADALPGLVNPQHRAHPHDVQPAGGGDRTARARRTRTS